MKRKIIKQGIDGLTIYLPKKWTEKQKLTAGDEVEINEYESNLIISSHELTKKDKTITLDLENGRETKRRIPLVNAYRAGYNKIVVNYRGDIKDLQKITNELIIGFELFKINENTYSLESVAEPDYEEFDKIIQKMFFILQDILLNLESNALEQQIHQVQKYDNLLKRLLTKNMLKVNDPFSLWHFLSIMTHVARQCQHLNENHTRKFNATEKKLQDSAVDMLKLLQKIYLTKDVKLLFKLHDMDQEIVYNQGNKLLKKGDCLYVHYLLSICREIYLTSSPLSSIITAEHPTHSV